ncbi:hypothetical protein CDL12_04106 [Handroanthus impetiginosus]|uniref:RING-CH-type domain-containing protein n=1 Tax=Handroanthus impetiginosus TaxID=429701 RepID=A0A2G9I085_9LAMI|nr:hypothetical protein CDL12_04106 [Handroanthus impetiginosus]
MFDINNVLIAENVQKAKCNCKLSLIHDNCARKWAEEKGSKCPSCGEQIKYVDVTLTVDASNSSPQRTEKENVQRPTYVSKRSSWCCFYIDDA